MTNLCTGIVTIDKRMQIARADKKFYEYIGFENFISLVNLIHPQDLEHFKEILAVIKEGESTMLVARLRRNDGEYHSMLIELLGLAVKQDSYVEIRIQDLNVLEDRIAHICDENNICNEFLDLWGEYLFRYDAARDDFRVFCGGTFNRVYAFRGTLREFEERLPAKGLVEESCLSDFRDFCADVANGTRSFEYKLLLLDEFDKQKRGIFLVQGRAVQKEKKETTVIGCMRRQYRKERGEWMPQSYEQDVTTGLLSKKAIIDYAENLLRHKPKYKVNLCIVDIDNFKLVNDTMGHLYGDQVLAEVAGILKAAVADKGLAGRIGGDELFVVLEGVDTLENLRGILRSIRSNIEWEYKDKKDVPSVTCSIGVSTYPDDAGNYDDLFKIADKMLYRAKEKGKNRYIVYTRDLHGDVLSESEMAAAKTQGKRQDREELVLGLLGCLAKRCNYPYSVIMENIGTAFGLDEVRLFYREGENVQMNSCWNAKEGVKAAESFLDFMQEENFIHLYAGYNIAVVDQTSLIEQICPDTYRYLTAGGVKAALIYKMNFARHEGYITYCKMSDSSRKWSDGDKEGLTYISRVIELMLNDQ